MEDLRKLFENNQRWREQILRDDPEFFTRLSAQQSPEFLWIGCSDSRVPANQVVGLPPGSIFVHRNIANLVVHTDFNCLSVLQYAIEVLKVRHIIVCGHYGCGGVRAALGTPQLGLADNWLRHIKDVFHKHREKIRALSDEESQVDLLCELNVKEQVKNVAHTTIVQQAWARGQEVAVHGLIYGLKDGALRDLGVGVSSIEDLGKVYRI